MRSLIDGLSTRIVVAMSLVVISGHGLAQEDVHGRFKPGERVECDFQHGGDNYRPGVVDKVEGAGSALTCCRYRVKIDNDDPLWKEGRLCTNKHTRRPGAAAGAPAGGTATPGKGATPPRTDASTARKTEATPAAQTVADIKLDRPLLNCPVTQKDAKNGSRPDPELIGKLIRCLYERPAPAGLDGASTVDITALKVGSSRKWVPRSDIGSGNLDTVVYPVKANWTQKTYYRPHTRVTENISIFNCYVNGVNEWQCGLGERIKDGEARNIPR